MRRALSIPGELIPRAGVWLDPGITPCVKTHTSAKCRKYNSPTRYRTSCAQHDSTPWCAISSRCFYVRGGRWSFRTWGNSGLKPYSGFGNQLSSNRQGSPHGALQSWRDAMEHYVGLDVSLKLTAICIVDRTEKIEREGVVASDPKTIAAFIKSHAPHVARVGLETGATSTWLWTELNKLGLPVICIDARHAKAALKLQINKSDRNDAVGIARIMQCGWYKEVRVKDLDSHAIKPFLSAGLCSSRSSGILRTKSAG